MDGWIKLHRKLKNKGYYKKSNYVHLWIHLLLEANHLEKEFMWNNEVVHIKKGQFLTGRKELSKETGIPETTIERILDLLEKEGQIGQQKTTKFRVITILKWDEYQITDNKRTTNGQQTDTNKNDKNDKNKTLMDYYRRWNVFAEKHNLAQILILNDKRKTAMNTRLKDPAFNFDKILEMIEVSDFLRGKKIGSTWKVDFDFIFSPNGSLKILEGKYTDTVKKVTVKPDYANLYGEVAQ